MGALSAVFVVGAGVEMLIYTRLESEHQLLSAITLLLMAIYFKMGDAPKENKK